MSASGQRQPRGHAKASKRVATLTPRYIATTPQGLEPVLAEEARDRLAPTGLRVMSGRVVFDHAGPPQQATKLRCPAEVWAYVREVAVPISGERSLRVWRAKLRRTRFDGALRALSRAGGCRAPKAMRVSVALAPQVKVGFIDVQSSAVEALGAASGLRPAGREADVQVRLLVEPERTTIGLLLPRPDGFARPNAPQSPLRPLAAAMLRLAQPSPQDTVLDLAGGDGLLLSEWAAVGARGRYLAGDRRWRDAAATREVAQVGKLPACFAVWRAHSVPLSSGAVDACLGLLTRAARNPETAAAALCREVARLLRSGGRAVLAAPRALGLPRHMQKPPLVVQRRLKVRVGDGDFDLLVAPRS